MDEIEGSCYFFIDPPPKLQTGLLFYWKTLPSPPFVFQEGDKLFPLQNRLIVQRSAVNNVDTDETFTIMTPITTNFSDYLFTVEGRNPEKL